MEKTRTEKCADGADEQGGKGEWRDEQRLKKMRKKDMDDWRDRKGKDGGQQAWTNGWDREERQREGHLDLLRTDERHYDRVDINKSGEK